MITIKENPLGTQSIGKLLATFAIPSIISMLISSLYNIVDQFFIGRSVGILGNAATNVAFPLTITCTALALMLGVGSAANFNLAMGRRHEEDAASYIGNAVFTLLASGVLLCIIVRLFLTPLMRLFGATDDVLSYALTYTGITSFGFPFLIFANGGSNLIRSDGSPKYSMVCMLVGAALNTILDPLFIFGFHMGIAGAAWATVIGQVVSALMIGGYLLRFKSVPLFLRHIKPSSATILSIVTLGAAPCFNQLAMMVVQVVMNNSLTYYGSQSAYGSDVPLACAGIIAKVGMIFFSLILGISQGLQPIVGYNYGAQKYDRVRQTYKLAITAATVISVVSFVCFQLFPRQIIGLFGTGTEEYFRFAEQYFRIYMFFTFCNSFQPITANFFTSIGKATRGIILSLTRQIIFLLPLILILPMLFGIDGIMYAGPVADCAAAILAIVLIRREFAVLKKLENGGNVPVSCT